LFSLRFRNPLRSSQAPAAFLRMIVVHEWAHLKEREHGKPFYALCTHMEPDYHQLEFDTRLWLTLLELTSTATNTVGALPSS
jgi:predicted metal-dependent hydrolase